MQSNALHKRLNVTAVMALQRSVDQRGHGTVTSTVADAEIYGWLQGYTDMKVITFPGLHLQLMGNHLYG